MKYPVALQSTPMEEKFGLNPPMGSFIRPIQMQRIKGLFEKGILKDLQEISDADPDAVGMAEWVNGRPDVTSEEFDEQGEHGDQQWIEMEGYEHWIKGQRNVYRQFKKTEPEEYTKKMEYWKKLRSWAKENSCLKNRKEFTVTD